MVQRLTGSLEQIPLRRRKAQHGEHPSLQGEGIVQASGKLGGTCLYGSSAAGIAAKQGVTKEQAEQFISMYLDAFPKIREYINESHQMAMQNGFVVTPIGRRKMEFGAFPSFKGTAAYNAALRNSQNVRIQSTASDIGLIAFSEVNRRVKALGGKCICTVYDSIEIEAPDDKLEEIIETCFYVMDDWVMERFPWMVLPIGVEGEMGPNWGDCRVVHRGWKPEM